ncbi:MAG: acetate kinase [Cyclobacteriaceae bacterium]
MKVLIINSGSSSIKFQLIQMPVGDVLCVGLIERIGLSDAQLHYKSSQVKQTRNLEIRDHHQGLQAISDILMDPKIGVVNQPDEIEVVGHRVVHGGGTFSATTLITAAVKKEIDRLSVLAPLHNPANLAGIEVAEKIFASAKQVAVFDTAFHQTIPGFAHQYAIPLELYEKHGIRVYGFHGTSHKYVSEKAKEMVSDSTRLITIHLGNGCSITAIKNGKSIDHSLGFSPVSGLVMGTRSGDVDPAIIFYLVKTLDYSLEEVNQMLQKKSGMLGLTGHSDLREIQTRAQNGDKACKLALAINAYRIKKYVGAYVAAMNGLDAVVFTGGIGENSAVMRGLICQDLSYIGLELDANRNEVKSDEQRDIASDQSKARILVIPTNEELEIAKQAYALTS